MRYTAYVAVLAILACSAGCAGFGKKKSKKPSHGVAAEQVAEVEAPPPAPPLTPEEFASWYQGCWGHFNERKWDEFAQCYAENAEAYEASNPATMKGRQEIVEKGAKPFAIGFEAKGEVQLTLINGKELLAITLFSGKQVAPLPLPSGEVPASNKPIGYLAAHRIQLDDQNKIQRQWFVFDTNTVLAQIGASKVKARKAVSRGWKEKVTAVATNEPAETANLEAAKKAFELFNAKDQAVANYFHRNVVDTNITLPADVTGKPAVTQFYKSLWTGFSDLRIEPESQWAAGAYTVMIGRMKGTNDGNFPQLKLKKSGKAIDVTFVEVIEWKDGKALRVMPFLDSLEMATQLGLVPPPPAQGAAPPVASAEPGASEPAPAAP